MNSIFLFDEMGVAPYVWFFISVFLFVLEGVSVQLISIWLGIGALISIIPASLGASVGVQALTFVISSIVLLVLTKPFCKKVMSRKTVQRTNADRVIGKTAVVIEEINNLNSTGRVRVEGLDWTARSQNGSVIEEGETVVVKSIEGVKVIVAAEDTVTLQ